MLNTLDSYREYAESALENYEKSDETSKYALISAIKDVEIKKVLDLGCGPGQQILPFLERTDAFCIGVDIAAELGEVTKSVFETRGITRRASFVRANGSSLPFADKSFDVILCQVAIPYMNNRQTFAEVSRILKSKGVFLLKVHAPAFYFGMMRQRLKTLNPKQMAYPLICLIGSLWHSLTGKQLEKGFWRGKEIFQTRNFVEKECLKNDLQIEFEVFNTSKQAPSFYITKR